jgi:hypothetical protein
MANTVVQTYVWKGCGDRFGEWEFCCRLRIFDVHPELLIVIVSNLRCDNGTTITNCAEQLATNVVKDFNLDPRSLTWIEHLPDSETEYSQVEFDWDRLQASYP